MEILCVDDDEGVLDLTATFLRRKLPGGTIHATTTIREAHDILETESITCIVSDYDMPKVTGLEFLRAVRADRPEVPFLLFTGKGSEEIASEAISAGVTDYLQKRGPEQYDRLAARIRHAVSEYRTERKLRERVKELTAIQRVSDLLIGSREQSTERLQQIVDDLPQAFQYPTHAVAHLTVDRDECTSTEFEPPAHSLSAHDCTASGTEVTLELGYVTLPSGNAGDPFVPEEQDLLEMIIQLITGYLDRQDVLADLQEADRRLKLILENTTAVMYLKDTEGRYVFVNAEYERLFDLTAEDVIGRTDSAIHAGEMSESVSDADRNVLETGAARKVEERITVDGDERIYLSSKVPARNETGEIEGVFDVSTDITEQKQRERQLEALNHTIPKLLSADTAEAIAECGVEAAREILDLHLNAIHLYDEDSDELVPVAKTDALSELLGELPTFTSEDSIAWRVFEERTATAIDDVRDHPEIHNPETPIRGELYLPLGSYGILLAGSPTASEFDQQDVTIGSLLAAHIVLALDELIHEQQLRERESELERKNERLDQFSSMVSHDLRTPLQIASGHLALYRDAGDESRLDTVQTGLDRMEELLTDLRALSRHGTVDDEREPVSLAELGQDAWAMIDTRSATLSTEAHTITASGSQLQALFENLFRNAVGHGGSDVTVRVGPLGAGFYVEDTGNGIPPEDRERVFDHGFSSGYGGSGIGLAIVDRIAEAHDWDISVTESAEGGARFEFRDVSEEPR